MDPFAQFLELVRWPRTLEKVGRERLLALWRFAIQPPARFRAEVFWELRRLLGSAEAEKWEEKDWIEVVEAMRDATVEERRSLVEVLEERLGNSRPELLERILKALKGTEDSGREPQQASSISQSPTVAIAAPWKKRKLEAPEDEMSASATRAPHNALIDEATLDKVVSFQDAVGEPHKVLMQEHTLDHILSFLPAECWKTARLVCRKWNDRVVENFHQKLTFVLEREKKTVWDEDSFLQSVDVRILSSITTGKYSSYCSDDEPRKELTLERFRSFGNLRILNFECSEERYLNLLIGVVNEGALRDLKELRLSIRIDFATSFKIVDPVTSGSNALAGLKHFRTLNFFYTLSKRSQGLDLFRARPLPAVLQSFVSAAPNLESLDCDLFLDLSGLTVKKLVLRSCAYQLLESEEADRMIDSVKESLTYLSLDSGLRHVQLPVLPNLVTLIRKHDWANASSMNFSAAPELRKSELCFDRISWEKIVSASGKLRDLALTEVPHPEDDELLVAKTDVLLTSGLTRFSMDFSYRKDHTILELRNFIELIRLEGKEEKRRKSTVLEFHRVCDKRRQEYFVDDDEAPAQEVVNVDVDPVRDFSVILEQLGGQWGMIRFVYFMFRTASRPSWSEAEVPLFDGKKKGWIKIRDGGARSQGATVTLEMK